LRKHSAIEFDNAPLWAAMEIVAPGTPGVIASKLWDADTKPSWCGRFAASCLTRRR
jgi:hypothetical protein